jgi:hypothetical protein
MSSKFKSANAAVLVLLIGGIWTSGCSHQQRVIVVNESGGQISSIFAGIEPNWVLSALARKGNREHVCRAKDQGLLAKFFGLFKVASVDAQSTCTADGCAGSYMFKRAIVCTQQGCQDSTIGDPWSDPRGDPNTGWHYDGTTTCGPCQNCDQNTCSTLPPGGGGGGGGGACDPDYEWDCLE